MRHSLLPLLPPAGHGGEWHAQDDAAAPHAGVPPFPASSSPTSVPLPPTPPCAVTPPAHLPSRDAPPLSSPHALAANLPGKG